MDAPKPPRSRRMRDLRWCNFLFFVSHSVSFLTILTWTAVEASNGKWPTIPTSMRLMVGLPSENTYTSRPIDVPMYPRLMSIMFAGMSATAHLLVVVPGNIGGVAGWDAYCANVRMHVNPLRWLEYGPSSTVLLLQIGGIAGLTEFAQMVCSAGCNFAMIASGHLAEKLSLAERMLQKELLKSSIPVPPMLRRAWVQAFIIGSFAGIAPWIAIFASFYGAISVHPTDVPWFVYTIIIGEFMQYFGFAVVMLVQHLSPAYVRRWAKKMGFSVADDHAPLKVLGLFLVDRNVDKRPDNDTQRPRCRRIVVKDFYELGEYLYAGLSFTSKTWLTWFSFFAPV